MLHDHAHTITYEKNHMTKVSRKKSEFLTTILKQIKVIDNEDSESFEGQKYQTALLRKSVLNSKLLPEVVLLYKDKQLNILQISFYSAFIKPLYFNYYFYFILGSKDFKKLHGTY